ncbi:unnamed protein product [Withania somnifera]
MAIQENGNGGVLKYKRIDSKAMEGDGVLCEEKRNDSSRIYVLVCAIFASLNSVLLGYDVGVMSGAIIFIQQDLKITEVQEEVLVGILSIISLLGSLAGGKTSDAIGRKWTMAFSATVLMIGRFLAGIGIGFGVMIAPVYIAEISPTAARGSFTSFPEIFINLGILLGYLAVGILPSVFIGIALFLIPESPRWLVMKNRIDEAKLVLLKTNENANEEEERLAEIQQAAGHVNAEKYEEKSVCCELLNPSPGVRRMLITGIDATVYYSPTIFKDAGIKGNTQLLVATVSVGFTKTIFILIAIFLIDKVGRKPLLYVSTIGMTTCLFGLGLTLSLLGNGSVGIKLAILCVSQASALGAVGSRVTSGVVAMSFLSVSRMITVGGTFFVFAAISALSVAFVHKCVPETKGKSLEEIEMMFQNDKPQGGGELELEDVKHLMQTQ